MLTPSCVETKMRYMQLLLDATSQFLELFIPLIVGLVWLTIDLAIFPMANPKKQKRILRVALAIIGGGTLGLFSRFLLPPQTSQFGYLLTLVTIPIVAGALLAQIARYRLRKRNQVMYGNFWIFFWLALSYLAARVNFHAMSLAFL